MTIFEFQYGSSTKFSKNQYNLINSKYFKLPKSLYFKNFRIRIKFGKKLVTIFRFQIVISF